MIAIKFHWWVFFLIGPIHSLQARKQFMLTSYHISFRSGRQVIKLLSPTYDTYLSCTPKKRSGCTIPSYHVTCLLFNYGTIWCTYYCMYKLIWHNVDNIITLLHALPPPLPSFSISAATSRQLPLAIDSSKPRHYLRLLSVPPVPGSLSTAAASQHQPPLSTTPAAPNPSPPKWRMLHMLQNMLKFKRYVYILIIIFQSEL